MREGLSLEEQNSSEPYMTAGFTRYGSEELLDSVI